MSMQDNAFDVEDACKKKCPKAAKELIEYTWDCEREISELRTKVHRMELCLRILKEMSIIPK